MAFLYGRAGRLTALFGGFRPGQLDRGDAACAAMHGHLYIIGGERRDCAATTGPSAIGVAAIVSHVEMFDPVSETFAQLTPLPDRRFRCPRRPGAVKRP
jgi:hypothetical protein